MTQNVRKRCLHFKHRELDFTGMNMKKTKRICTITQEETCLSGEHFSANDKKKEFVGKAGGPEN